MATSHITHDLKRLKSDIQAYTLKKISLDFRLFIRFTPPLHPNLTSPVPLFFTNQAPIITWQAFNLQTNYSLVTDL